MKKLLTALFLSIALSGCATWTPEKDVVVKQEYIIRIPPAESMTLPDPVTPVDTDKIDQGDVSRWLLDKEKYIETLEGKLKSIANFFIDEQKKLDKK